MTRSISLMADLPFRRHDRRVSLTNGGYLAAAALLVMLAVTLIAYWPGLRGGFALDDYPNIVDNAALDIHNLSPDTLSAAAFSAHAGPLRRPLAMLTFALDRYEWGLSPYAMKATNLAIHLLNGLLVYVVVVLILAAYRRGRQTDISPAWARWIAVAITAAWLVLPINLTAVLYVVQRMTSLSATFVLVGLGLYLWGRLRMLDGRGGLWMLWTGIAACGSLAVLVKETGALLPLYALVIEWVLFDFARATGGRDRRLYVLYAVLLVVPGVLGLLWFGPSQFAPEAYATRPFTLGERLLTEPRVLMDYIGWSLIPTLHTLSLYHDDFPFSRSLVAPSTTLIAIAGTVALVALAIWQRKRRPLLSLGILWFFAGQLLEASIFNLELVYEHRNYLPSLGLIVAALALLLLPKRDTWKSQRLRWTVVVATISLYALLTGLRAQQWSNPLRFAAVAAAEHPNSPRATYALGRIYALMVDGPESKYLPLAIAALRRAAAVPHSSILPEQGLLMVSAEQHRPLKPAWWHGIEDKLARRHATVQDISALHALASCAISARCQFPTGEIADVFSVALRANPANPEIPTVYSEYALNALHKYALARRLMLKALQIAPHTAQYRINLIKLDVFLKRFADARRGIQELRALGHFGSLRKTERDLAHRLLVAEVGHTANPAPAIANSGEENPSTTRGVSPLPADQ